MKFKELDKVWIIQGGQEKGACPGIVIGEEHGMYVLLKFTHGLVRRYISNPKWVLERTVDLSEQLFQIRKGLLPIKNIKFELP